ncbi:hypothetical protein SKTS_35110 [Sulfurimicrobium lacus]|uniref:Uncharacterized protein n=1 Tax=Sulfurimicrobium lacus TaxID=2715678 RepID=A0A6F8VIN0_9PROT|nr:hypothetical protein [Sulfurimicrobium lacus]BCB28625.1 hypothetical protein SKTS_35110 [Sulfurimicrobium lacus]
MKKIILIVAALAAVALATALLRPSGSKPGAQAITGLPWQIEILPDGHSKVFGLTLAASTLGDARQRFGSDMEVALVAAPGEAGSLEAYYNQVTAGVLTGKMILTAALDKESVERMRQNAVRKGRMESTTRKFSLSAEDLAQAYATPIESITFIPSASFDADIALSHFGQPAERIRSSAQVENLLYPAKGLSLTLDSEGKEVLQYVTPQQFARLRDPLLKHH